MSTVFVAGATGVVGRRLLPMLRDAGWTVFGTTRRAERANAIEQLGARPVIVDVFDAGALVRAVAEARPDVVIHQLTDLPPALDPARMAEAVARNARIRDEGTRHLVAAAREAGARRIVAQSIAWMYAAGAEPHGEDDPLDLAADGARGVSVRGVASLESQVLGAQPLEGVVLRYGHLYGPGTGTDVPPASAPLHVDEAARAALLASDRGSPGIYNVVERDDIATAAKARRALGWRPGVGR
jgi:nucleoside-diphosphate-sugar epimerase